MPGGSASQASSRPGSADAAGATSCSSRDRSPACSHWHEAKLTHEESFIPGQGPMQRMRLRPDPDLRRPDGLRGTPPDAWIRDAIHRARSRQARL